MMHVDENDHLGTILVTDGLSARFYSYYSTVDALRPLFQLPEWKSQTTGWYLNVGDNEFTTVRISYFCRPGNDPRPMVAAFLSDHSLSSPSKPCRPKKTKFADRYGGVECRFRSYLSTYSYIGLDIMAADLHYAQCLFATYRWQVFMSQGSCREHFAPSFESMSRFYSAMPLEDQERFWLDFASWPNPPEVDWAHMFLNMVLACDWLAVFRWSYPQKACTIPEINAKMRSTEHMFQIPEQWKRKGAYKSLNWIFTPLRSIKTS